LSNNEKLSNSKTAIALSTDDITSAVEDIVLMVSQLLSLSNEIKEELSLDESACTVLEIQHDNVKMKRAYS
jgi:hypothetical protein